MKKPLTIGVISVVILFLLLIILNMGMSKSTQLEQKVDEATLNAENKAIVLIEACTKAETDQDFQTCTIGWKDVLELCKTNSDTFQRVCGGENQEKFYMFTEMLRNHNEKKSGSTQLEEQLDESIEKMDNAANQLLNECIFAETNEDFRNCFAELIPAIEKCKEYPSMKVCNSDKLQMVLDLAEEKLE